MVAPPPETEDSFYPGTVHSGGVTSLLAPRTAKQQFEFETRLEALSKGWPQQRHLEIERKQRIPIVGGYIARQLHTRMIKGLRE